MAPNGTGMETHASSSVNYADRATNKTLKEMTNPFISKIYGNQQQLEHDNDQSSNLYSYDQSMPLN